MARAVVLPHRTAGGLVTPGPWRAVVNGVELRSVERLAGWDHDTPVRFVSEVEADPAELRRSCGLDANARLTLLATWHASATNCRRVGAQVVLEHPGPHRLEFDLDQSSAAGRLELTRAVVLESSLPSDDEWAPSQRGAYLWRERRGAVTVQLDEEESWLPIEVLDFRAMAELESEAAWYLDVGLHDLEAPPSESLTLFVNAEHPTIDRLLEGALAENEWVVQSMLHWDVARALVQRALDEPEFIARFGRLPAGSVGGALQQLFERWLPGVAPATLRSLARDEPGRFEAVLQGRLKLLREP
jgi:hypothetical protein